jgi:hypothetical protein
MRVGKTKFTGLANPQNTRIIDGMMKQKIGILPGNYREQKSREQAEYQAAARKDPSLVRRGQVFKGICKDHVVKIVFDPYDVDERQRYGY